MNRKVEIDYSPRTPWIRTRPDGLFHILGPQLPRWMPVSPEHVAPCGAIIVSDRDRETAREPKEGACGICRSFADSRLAGLV
jgi:hypothetical protein